MTTNYLRVLGMLAGLQVGALAQTVWTQIATTGPTARVDHAMAYHSQRGRMVLFGGYDGGGFPVDTWEWDGTAWTQVSTSGPTGRLYHAMAYDSQRDRTVLFGGGGNGVLGDTWEWDGTTWLQVASTGPSRRNHAMGYDGQIGKTVLFGGQGGGSSGFFGDTWQWLGSGSSSPFGAGCGSPALSLAPVASALPTVNTTAQASLTNIPSSLAFVAIGWSRTAVGPFTLPLSLATYGMPGCDLLQSGQEMALPTTPTGPGAANYSLPLPNWSGLIGLHLYLQGWAVAPGVNPGHTIVSNGLEWVIGS